MLQPAAAGSFVSFPAQGGHTAAGRSPGAGRRLQGSSSSAITSEPSKPLTLIVNVRVEPSVSV